MARAELVIAVGNEVRDECTGRFRVASRRVVLVPNGRDPSLLRPRSEPVEAAGATLIFVGALTPQKQPDRFIEVVRRLWDSWEDDAEIRDVATGRFIDRDKLHYIDFEGKWFSVKGPSVTPRPPQGQPPVSVLAHVPVAFALAARCCPSSQRSRSWSSWRRVS